MGKAGKIQSRSSATAAKAKVDMQQCSSSESRVMLAALSSQYPCVVRLVHAAAPFQTSACRYAYSEVGCSLRLVHAAECSQACCVASGLWEAAQSICSSGDATERWLVAAPRAAGPH